MVELIISGAQKSFGPIQVLDDVSLDVKAGEFVVIVGPSGCGKSTLLRAIAGLEDLDGGSISIGNRQVDTLAPARRGIAMVFQSYALYPHLTVYENMAFALRVANASANEISAAVTHAARILGIEPLLDRKPKALSGGQRQRVAIGRAIVRAPDVFLFDEPLSNLDAGLRVRMRYEFAALHRMLATTTLYVTHDQVEAMTLADRIVVMRAGRIEQVGTPRELYDRPANMFVAQFLGSNRMNVMEAEICASGQSTADGRPLCARLASGIEIALPADTDLTVGSWVSLGIRPEDIVQESSGQSAVQSAQWKIRFVERLGGFANVHLGRADETETLLWQARDDDDLAESDDISLVFPADKLHIFDGDGRSL